MGKVRWRYLFLVAALSVSLTPRLAFAQVFGFAGQTDAPCGPHESVSCRSVFVGPFFGGPTIGQYDPTYFGAGLKGISGFNGSMPLTYEFYTFGDGMMASWNNTNKYYVSPAPFTVLSWLRAVNAPAGTYTLRMSYYESGAAGSKFSPEYPFVYYPEVNSLAVTVKDQTGAPIASATVQFVQRMVVNNSPEVTARSALVTNANGFAYADWCPANTSVKVRVLYGANKVSPYMTINIAADPTCPLPAKAKLFITLDTGANTVAQGAGTDLAAGTDGTGSTSSSGIFTDKTDAQSWISSLFVPSSAALDQWTGLLNSMKTWGPFGLLSNVAAVFGQAAVAGDSAPRWQYVPPIPGCAPIWIDFRPTSEGGTVAGDWLQTLRGIEGWATYLFFAIGLWRWVRPRFQM